MANHLLSKSFSSSQDQYTIAYPKDRNGRLGKDQNNNNKIEAKGVKDWIQNKKKITTTNPKGKEEEEEEETSSSEEEDSTSEEEEETSGSGSSSEEEEDSDDSDESSESTTTTTASEIVKPLLPQGPSPRRYVNIATGLGTERINPFRPGTSIKSVKGQQRGQQLIAAAASGEGPHVKSNEQEIEGQSPRRQGGKRRRKKRPVTICLTHCRYELVRSMSKRYTLVEVPEDTAWNIYWTDYSVSLERAVDMRRFQIVNHFPGMNEICRKDLLARNLNRMKRVFPEEYNIYPMTWCLPADNNELQSYSLSRRGKTYICKPEMGCQGRGIFLVKNIKDVNPFGRIICQIYIQKPFLIDHLKFDLRIYVLITSCDPLRVWVFEEGLARFATAKYRIPTQNNTENSYMHLTNYAVNKFSRDFVVDEDSGTKRKLTTVMNWLRQRDYDTDTLEKEIDDVIIKTILSAQPTLKHHYRTCFPHHDVCSACFEILGFDILLDHKLKPYVIEVNHSPSFHTDTKLDREIKESLLNDTFAMLNFKHLDRGRIEREDRRRVQERITSKLTDFKTQMDAKTISAAAKGAKVKGGKKALPKKEEPPKPKERKTKEDYNELQFQWELENCGSYKLIYPIQDSAKYDKFLAQNQTSLYQETAASQARASLTKAKIDEYNIKKQLEEQKRGGGSSLSTGISGIGAGQVAVKEPKASSSKEKLRPESDGKSFTSSEVAVNKKTLSFKSTQANSLLPTNPSNGTNRCFTLCHIVSKDECDRVRGLIQRGLLIRSLGIELQAYQLLCKVGGLKKLEHDEFRRKHGFFLPNPNPNNNNIIGAGGSNTFINTTFSRPNSIIPPKFYMKLNQFSVDTASEHSSGTTGRPIGTATLAMQKFARRERATTSHAYRF